MQRFEVDIPKDRTPHKMGLFYAAMSFSSRLRETDPVTGQLKIPYVEIGEVDILDQESGRIGSEFRIWKEDALDRAHIVFVDAIKDEQPLKKRARKLQLDEDDYKRISPLVALRLGKNSLRVICQDKLGERAIEHLRADIDRLAWTEPQSFTLPNPLRPLVQRVSVGIAEAASFAGASLSIIRR